MNACLQAVKILLFYLQGGYKMWDKIRYHPTEIVRAPSPNVHCIKCNYKQKNLHTRIKSFYPHSVAAAYVVAADDDDTKACVEYDALSTKDNAHPGQLMHTKQRCYDSKVAGIHVWTLFTFTVACSF
jgi:hypothetical protein